MLSAAVTHALHNDLAGAHEVSFEDFAGSRYEIC
jgi:hypothetical protein